MTFHEWMCMYTRMCKSNSNWVYPTRGLVGKFKPLGDTISNFENTGKLFRRMYLENQ